MNRSLLYHLSRNLCLVALAFLLLLGCLLAAESQRASKALPGTEVIIADLRGQIGEKSGDQQFVDSLRDLDLLYRQTYFRHHDRMNLGRILAAAGLYALDHHIERLADDHRHARMIAESLERSGWAQVDMEGVETNIIFFTVPTMETQEVLDRLKAVGILANTEGSVVRLVTNLDISLDDTLAICALIEGMEMTR